MIYTGSRIYSLAEINDMCVHELDEQFLDYLKRAPSIIRWIVLKKIENDGYREYLENIFNENDLCNTINVECECDNTFSFMEKHVKPDDMEALIAARLKVVSLIKNLLNKENEILNDGLLIIEDENEKNTIDVVSDNTEKETIFDNNVNVIDEENNIVNISPYSDLKFGTRITVNELYFSITEDNKCQKHNSNLNKQQVVVKYGCGKNYGMMLEACYECKKLFMPQSKYMEFLPILKEHKIVYHIMNI